jgi:hypothetical protein
MMESISQLLVAEQRDPKPSVRDAGQSPSPLPSRTSPPTPLHPSGEGGELFPSPSVRRDRDEGKGEGLGEGEAATEAPINL